MEKNLNEKIIGQSNAISILCKETKKIKLGLREQNKPISFFFTGKSGVGKTELVKEYARELNMNLIRIDASEYKESHTISKIIGSPPGYVGYENYSILDEIKNHPYSIILIDEIEKSCSDFLNLFLQILDEGFITNSSLEKIYFNHTIIIMTSNIASNINSIGFNQNESFIKRDLEETFSLEFLNRITHIIRFKDLDDENIKEIIKLELKNVKEKFKDQKINIKIQRNIINEIIKMSNYKESGARNIKKIIEDKIDSIIIDNLLDGNKTIEIKELV